MRFIKDDNDRLLYVSFGADISCDGQACTEYTGDVPNGYTSLEAWYIAEQENLHRWTVVDLPVIEDGTTSWQMSLVEDENAETPVEDRTPGVASVVGSGEPPDTGYNVGDFWFDRDGGHLYICTDDATWAQLESSGGSGDGSDGADGVGITDIRIELESSGGSGDGSGGGSGDGSGGADGVGITDIRIEEV